MTVTLDAISEQRVQRAIQRGPFRDPLEVVAYAVFRLVDMQERLEKDRQFLDSLPDSGQTLGAILDKGGDPNRAPDPGDEL